MTGFAFSLTLGLLLGAVHAVAACVMALKASRRETKQAVRLVMGGMVVRMIVVVALFAFILIAFPVDRGVFVGAFGVTLLAGLIIEAVIITARSRSAQPAA